MRFEYLGRVPVSEAILRQTPGVILGFEPAVPVVTLGIRGDGASDIVALPADIEVLHLDRGGQATLHNPGQLVIFPVLDVRAFGGARRWVETLSTVSQRVGERFGCRLSWNAQSPGLYNKDGGKVIALGVRIQRGISTHGLAINVRNNLAEFAWIRSCGQTGARVAHLPTDAALSEVFRIWVEELATEVDKSANLAEFMDRSITDGSVGAVGSAFP